MTTPTEDEAEAEARRRWPTVGLSGSGHGYAIRSQLAFAEGVAWAASRVSTPPSGTADLRAFAAELRDRYPEDVFAPLSDADHRSVNDALAGRAERTHVTRDRVSADMMRRAAKQAIEYAEELDDGRATPPTDEDERHHDMGRTHSMSEKFERGTVAAIHVIDGDTESWPIAERTGRGWQSGVKFYPDEKVIKVTAVYVRMGLSEWEYGERHALGGVWPIDPEIKPELWASTPIEDRVRRRPAGPWEPVPTEGEAL